MLRRRQITSWLLYDFANSSFAVIIVAFVFAVYFKKVVAANQPIADLYWAISINISMLIVALLNPILGAASDISSNKKTYLIFFSLLCIAATALLYFTEEGTVLYAMCIFIVANIGFQTALTFYDAFLPQLTTPSQYNAVSSLGYAIGYVGSLVAVLMVLPMQETPRLTFLATAGMFFIFSLPAFFFSERGETSARYFVSQCFFHRIAARAENAFKNKRLCNAAQFSLCIFCVH